MEPDADQGYSKSLTFIQKGSSKSQRNQTYTAKLVANNHRTEMGRK